MTELNREPVREPVFNLPRVVLLLLAAMTLVHFLRTLLPEDLDLRLIATYAFVPARFGFLFDPQGVVNHLTAVARVSEIEADMGQFFLTYASDRGLWATPFSYALLHGDWTHLIFNGVWLAAFGSPVARRFGSGRFLLLGALGAAGGAFFYFFFHRFELAPLVGASAAVSAYMGAASRFVFQADSFLRWSGAGPTRPLAGLRELFRNRQTLAFVGFWFATNLLIGVGGQSFGFSSAPVAWEAHIGGFLVGLFLAPAFDQRRKA